MIICHCHGITDRELLRAGREQAAGRRADSPVCHAGNACGGCRPLIEELLRHERGDGRSRPGANAVAQADE